ncbi:MAG: SCO1664 family protein [Chloroflexi bacterium]|nr:SCO1664 family protein [Chloroflexota bacterium]
MTTESNTGPTPTEIIRHGEIISAQLTPLGSNYTFLVNISLEGAESLAIYKPRDGEAPLWDFPSGTLYKREYAAYLLSQILGWDIVPFTIIRDGPHGIGSVQQFVEHDPKQNYYTMEAGCADQLRVIALFDLVANSTDRKANHLLLGDGGKIWSIDHGLTFHSDMKIRTVIWDFCSEEIPEPLLNSLTSLRQRLDSPADSSHSLIKELIALLPPEEVEALMRRLQWVLAERVYPGLPRRNRRRRG